MNELLNRLDAWADGDQLKKSEAARVYAWLREAAQKPLPELRKGLKAEARARRRRVLVEAGVEAKTPAQVVGLLYDLSLSSQPSEEQIVWLLTALEGRRFLTYARARRVYGRLARRAMADIEDQVEDWLESSSLCEGCGEPKPWSAFSLHSTFCDDCWTEMTGRQRGAA